MHANKKWTTITVLTGLVFAIGIPFSFRWIPKDPQTHEVVLKAQKYGYLPSKIVVNKGDTIVFKPTSLDVTHGFYLDGHDLEFIIKPQGITYLKYAWEDDDGKANTDWDQVREVEFLAEKTGKFVFRCTQTCGNLHPFMSGELVVRPNTPYHLAISLSVWIFTSLFLLFQNRTQQASRHYKRINLLTVFPWLKWLVKRRSFQFLLLFPGFMLFYLFIISNLWGNPVGNRNIGIIFVWILWWFALKALFVPLGARIWCLVCPLPGPAEWLSRKSFTVVHYIKKPFRTLHHRFVGLQKDWPEQMQNMWLQNFIFMAMISFGIILITRPLATAILFLAILGATLGLVFFFRRRVFCLYLCPVGGFLGNYSMASITEIRAIDPEVCRAHKDKCCYVGGEGGWACPWGQYMGRMRRNNYCGFCTECIKSCTKDNIGIFLRPFGSGRSIRGYDEMFNVMIMMVVAIAFSVTMLGHWGFVKQAANVTESRQMAPFLIYLAVLWGSALLIFPGLFMMTARAASRIAGEPAEMKSFALHLSYIFIPIGIFAWIAFSLPPIATNYNYILIVMSDPFGWGWDLFGTADFPFTPFLPRWIPIIQGGLLLAGLYFGISRGFLALQTLVPDPKLCVKSLFLPALLGWLVVNILIKLYLG